MQAFSTIAEDQLKTPAPGFFIIQDQSRALLNAASDLCNILQPQAVCLVPFDITSMVHLCPAAAAAIFCFFVFDFNYYDLMFSTLIILNFLWRKSSI